MFFNSMSKLSQKVRDNKDNQSDQSDQPLDTPLPEGRFARFFSKMKGQPASYANKQHYIFGKTLGAGAFGVVRQARNVQTSENVAIKILLKKALKGQELQMLYEELAILRKLDHPNIVKFKDWFESKDKFYIVTQLATGGELFDRILDKGKFTERDAAEIIVQLLQAVEYMHSQNVVHRDLKPENVLYLDQSDNSQLVISDFGIAKQLSGEHQLLHKAAGSMGYVAPEVLTTSGHGKPCDIWSLGVITYTLLSGYSPFIAESTEGFLEEVSRDEFPVVFHQPYWNNISVDAKEFILKALTLDTAARPSATELLKDKWLISTRTTGKDLLPAIREGFDASKKLRAVLHVVILDNRIKRLKQLYGVSADDNDEEEDDTDLDENSPDSCGRAIGSLKDALRSISLKPQAECSVQEKRIKSELTQHAFAQLVLAAKGNKEKILKYQEQEGRTPSSPSSESK